jgi:hypothetical protein
MSTYEERLDKVKEEQTSPKGFDFNRSFATDTRKEVDGAWAELNIDGQTLEVLVAREGNRRYKSYMRGLLKRHERILRRDDDKANELFERLENEAIAHTILLGWKDLYITEGGVKRKAEYSPELAQKLLEYQDFKKAILDLSSDFNLFREQQDEAIIKN